MWTKKSAGLSGLALAALLAAVPAGSGRGAEFYVAADGDDAAPGTRLQPFRTLAAASRAAQPGDVCMVRRGLYRETLKPARSGKFGKPILYAAAPGETVTLSSVIVLDGWQVHSGAVYKLRTPPPIQILVDGLPALAATTMPGEDLHPRAAWWTAPDGLTYMRFPNNDGPAGHRVEAQVSPWAADLAGASHITLRGFAMTAGGINLDNASHCRAEDCHLWWTDTGILLGGRDNDIASCSLVGSMTAGIVFRPDSANNRVVNCLVRGDATGRQGAAGVRVCGTAHVVRNSTLSDWAAGALVCSNLLNGRLTFNDLRNEAGTLPGIALLRISGDGKGTVAAFNRIRENRSAGGAGVFLDETAENHIIHHNVITHQSGPAFRVHGAARYVYICNNTCAMNGAALDIAGEPPPILLRGSRIANNILPGLSVPTGHGAVSNAVAWESNFGGDNPGFTDAANGHFTLAEGSPCIDSGHGESDLTDDCSGKAPDIGAYEYGVAPWVAGCTASANANETAQPLFRLILESSTPQAQIRYTLDGRPPGPTSALYTGPIHAAQGTIRAKAFMPGMEDSPSSGIVIRPAE